MLVTRLPLSTNALPWIQVLRGLAASLVVAGHSLLEARTFYPAWRALETGFAYSYGVDVFFVISGFIMVSILLGLCLCFSGA
jgi:peptidoglycan/LPS O-acetylase OafA/YrhL